MKSESYRTLIAQMAASIYASLPIDSKADDAKRVHEIAITEAKLMADELGIVEEVPHKPGCRASFDEDSPCTCQTV